MSADRNRTTVRRALRAGAVVGLGAALTALAGALSGAVPGSVVIASGIAGASLAAAAWLLLSALLDVLAGDPPDLRRTAWTAGATLLAMSGPFLLLGTLAQGTGAGR